MHMFDFVNRSNADYIDRLYQQYQKDPRSIDEPWLSYFAGFDAGVGRSGVVSPASTLPSGNGADGEAAAHPAIQLGDIGVQNLVHTYRELGHTVAKLDPLGHDRPNHPLLELSQFGISPADLDRKVSNTMFYGQFDGTLRDLVQKLRDTYCRCIGVEYQDIPDKTQREWLAQRMEPVLNKPTVSPDRKREILYQITAAQGFEEFLATKYVGGKRFSVEGGEAVIPLLNTVIDEGANHQGVEEFVTGMAHRGRLNVLAHVMNKPYEQIISEFEGTAQNGSDEGDGDVKYHLGYSQERTTAAGKNVHLALSFNPSHLELVNPVVEGIVRAKQYMRGDDKRTKVVPILIHGDAAFVGQGIVQETLALSEMPYWRTGGTIHVIVNNQIGFTTMPKQGRFTPYPTDIAKAIQAPIFHVNGDDPEAVAWVAKLAMEFRQQFHVDVIIDLWCYRRHGHNETDEPSYTQPLMYKEIDAHPRLRELYGQRLVGENAMSETDLDEMKAAARARFDKAYAIAKENRPRPGTGTFGGVWKGMTRAGGDWTAKTNVSADVLRQIADATSKIPDGFTVHPKLKKLVQNRGDMGRGKFPIDWGGAEQLAMASLLLEGTPIRFTGQDAQRGTFSHRHACLHDYETGAKHYPLANISPKQAPFIIVNTMLSELAVLGFEYGFSSADPRNLVIWEAQFGDFVNGAMPIIDQFLVAAESKWGKMCGLVMLLPHGYEGQGPEHSNAYVERWLQLSADNNIQVVYPSTPAQYFHVLRRQMKRSFRKPLVMFMPKSILRSDQYASQLEELTQGGFQNVIDDPSATDAKKIKRLLLCSGKVYYTLASARAKANITDTAIVRVEQLYPFPRKEVAAILTKYGAAEEIGWAQEEPKNRGAWTYIDPLLREMLPDWATLTYFGREEAASPATGSMKMHKIEEEELIDHALDLTGRNRDDDGGDGASATQGGPSGGGNVAKQVAAQVPATAPKKQGVSG
ncbi:MAG TPA: 2-oxoglutarate dehydrogenase E1 component [Tepidisphaeraceae bacterium]|jgi:2-oxoglutarate dehydrogenase E1 component|nr:2-oxoglutarate dehydrogenase E1 component [Tepidisphaeraceae bacterium]